MKSYTVLLALILAGCSTESTPDAGKPDAAPERPNYLVNAEFDESVDGWRSGWPTEWNEYHGAEAKGSAKVTASSTYSTAGRPAFSQCLNLQKRGPFQAAISYSMGPESTQTGGGRIRISWSEQMNCGGTNKASPNHADIDETAGAGWHRLEITNLEAPESAKSARMEIIQTISGVGDFIVYWDDAYLSVAK